MKKAARVGGLQLHSEGRNLDLLFDLQGAVAADALEVEEQ